MATVKQLHQDENPSWHTKHVGREREREGKIEGGRERGGGREGVKEAKEQQIFQRDSGHRKGSCIFPVHFSVSRPGESSEWFLSWFST